MRHQGHSNRSTRARFGAIGGCLVLAAACGSEFQTGNGGVPDASSGAGGASAGGARTGGSGPKSGGSTASGGASTAGTTAAGGAATGGALGTGGTGRGGTPGNGGAGTGGTGAGGLGTAGAPSTCVPACDFGLGCCAGRCVNHANDILNCGECGKTCGSNVPYCDNGTCGAPPCFGVDCPNGLVCCGGQCCGANQLCCTVNVGPSVTECTAPVDGTCPVGCPGCVCASPDTPVATPSGDVPIAALRVGDLVLSVHQGAIRAVPIRQTNRARVSEHHVVRLTFATGAQIEMSPPHPTADGRTFADLAAGEDLGGARILAREVVPYAYPHTYDILPDSDTGAYFAAGILVGSTLSPGPR